VTTPRAVTVKPGTRWTTRSRWQVRVCCGSMLGRLDSSLPVARLPAARCMARTALTSRPRGTCASSERGRGTYARSVDPSTRSRASMDSPPLLATHEHRSLKGCPPAHYTRANRANLPARGGKGSSFHTKGESERRRSPRCCCAPAAIKPRHQRRRVSNPRVHPSTVKHRPGPAVGGERRCILRT